MTDDIGELLTMREVSAWLRVSYQTVWRMTRDGVFHSTHVGSARRIYRASVVAYLREQEQAYKPTGSRATLGDRTSARFRALR